jgi:hypothetical protein
VIGSAGIVVVVDEVAELNCASLDLDARVCIRFE